MAAPPLPSTNYLYKTVLGTNPTAGNEVSDVVPAGKWWWLISVTVQLVQGATQTPLPSLVLTSNATNNIYTSPGSTTAMTAATTAQFTWGVGLVVSGLIGATPNIVSTGSLAEYLFLPAGATIKTSTAGIGANTDYGAPAYYVCEFTI